MNSQQFRGSEYTLRGSSMNLLAVLFLLPVLTLLAGPYIWLHGYYSFHQGLKIFIHYLIVILPLGVVVHELLHGLTWAYFAEKGFKSISFGINWKALAPYCHCSEPLQASHYKLGGVMPGLLMGFVPAVLATIFQIDWLVIFGVFFTWAASGDFMVLWMLRKFNGNTMVYDHPDKLGFYVKDRDAPE